MGLDKVKTDKFVPSLSTIEVIETLNENDTVGERSIETLFNNDIEPIIRKTTTK